MYSKRIPLMLLLLGVMLFAVGSVVATTSSQKCQTIIDFTDESPPVPDKDVLGFSSSFEVMTDATYAVSVLEQGQDCLSSEKSDLTMNAGWMMNGTQNANMKVVKNAALTRTSDWRIELSTAVRIDRQNDAFCMDYMINCQDAINPAGQRAAPIHKMEMSDAMTTNSTVANSGIIPNKVWVHQVANANIWQSHTGKSSQDSYVLEDSFDQDGLHNGPAPLNMAVTENRRYPNPFA